MPTSQILLLAVTKMLTGICTAGLTTEPDPIAGLRWVRPVRDFGAILPGDMAGPDGQLLSPGDVVEMELLAPRPDPPHTEDWLVDFVHHRPRWLRRLSGGKRDAFFRRYLDRAPEEVLVRHTRSLCLVQPERVWARFRLDSYSAKYEARLGFCLGSVSQAVDCSNISVTDVKWRALGRSWLPPGGGELRLDQDALYERLSAGAIYLALGLSRRWKQKYWPLVVGVHVVPDYEAAVDTTCL